MEKVLWRRFKLVYCICWHLLKKKLCLSLGLNSSQMTLNPKLNIFLRLCSSSTNQKKKSLSESANTSNLRLKHLLYFGLKRLRSIHSRIGLSVPWDFWKQSDSSRQRDRVWKTSFNIQQEWLKESGRKTIVWLRQFCLILNKIQTLKLLTIRTVLARVQAAAGVCF